jgi:hypothetical protein
MGRPTGGKKKIINNYKGWDGKKIDEIDADVDPKVFWRDYISQRKPVRCLSSQIFIQIQMSSNKHQFAPPLAGELNQLTFDCHCFSAYTGTFRWTSY